MHNKRRATAIYLETINKPPDDRYKSRKRALTNAPLEPPAQVVIGQVAIESFTAHMTHHSQIRALTNMLDRMVLPEEFEKARLFRIEIPDIKTLQSSQVVRSHSATESPVPINDHK